MKTQTVYELFEFSVVSKNFKFLFRKSYSEFHKLQSYQV